MYDGGPAEMHGWPGWPIKPQIRCRRDRGAAARGAGTGSLPFPDMRAGPMLRCERPPMRWNAPARPVHRAGRRDQRPDRRRDPGTPPGRETWRRRAWSWCRSAAPGRCRSSWPGSGRPAPGCASAACAMPPKSGTSAVSWRGPATAPPDTRSDLEREGFFVCDRDLEDELIRAVGPDAIEAILAEEGDLASFRTLQKQAAWRDAGFVDQLRRFLGAGARRKLRYASLFVLALDLDRQPRPLQGVLSRAYTTPHRR